MDVAMLEIDHRLSNKLSNMALLCSIFVVAMHSSGPRRILGMDLFAGGMALVAVPFFFLASGFFLAAHMRDDVPWLRLELQKRLKSLVIPFFLWNATWIAMMFTWTFAMNLVHGNMPFLDFDNVLINGVSMQLHDMPRPLERIPMDAVAAMGLDPVRLPFVQQLWYVRALLVLICISPLLRRFANPMGLIVLFALYILLRPWGGKDDGGYFLAMIAPLRVRSFFRIFLSAEGMFYFTVGIFLRNNPIRLSRGTLQAVLALGIVLLLAFAVCDARHIMVDGRYFRLFALPLLMIAIWHFVPDTTLPKWLATSAFPVFLCHRCVLFALRCVHFPNVWLLNVIGAVIGSLVFSVVFRRIAPRLSSLFFGGR